MIDCKVVEIAYAYVIGSKDWKTIEVQWSESKLVATLLKLRGRIGFVVAFHILCMDSCQWEAGAIQKLGSRKLNTERKDRWY